MGNKCDLEEERMVSFHEGEELAREFNCPFFEASAKEHTNVDESFAQLVREIRKVKGKSVHTPETTGVTSPITPVPVPIQKKKKSACFLL